jgi:hypothetical protein
MGDINNDHDDAEVVTLLVAMYALHISYLALVFLPYVDMLGVLSLWLSRLVLI